MNRIITIPESKDHWLALRHKNINSTEVSSLYGCNPYQTEFELWHSKQSDDYISIEETARMKWGNRLQDAIANGVASDNCWSIRPMTEYIYDEDLRLGSSFDYLVNDSEILEIKNVDGIVFSKEWTDLEAPAHIEMQVQVQMLVSGYKRAHICALVGGNSVHLIEREYNEDIGNSILKKVAQFWARTDAPSPDFHKDAEFIKSLYQNVHGHKVIEADSSIDQLAEKYKIISEKIKELEENKEATKAELLTLIRDAEKVKGNGYTISAGITAESQVSFTRKSFRNFRINFTKQKDNQ